MSNKFIKKKFIIFFYGFLFRLGPFFGWSSPRVDDASDEVESVPEAVVLLVDDSRFHSFCNSSSMVGVMRPWASNRSVSRPRPAAADRGSRGESMEILYLFHIKIKWKYLDKMSQIVFDLTHTNQRPVRYWRLPRNSSAIVLFGKLLVEWVRPILFGHHAPLSHAGTVRQSDSCANEEKTLISIET